MSDRTVRCEELEVVLCDYLDGTLDATQLEAVTLHLDACPACREMADDVSGAIQFMGRVSEVTPPPELITRIVLETTGLPGEPARAGWRRFLGRFLDPVLQPRFAMSMALTFLSFAMIGKLVGVESKPFRQADLNPVRLWLNLEDSAQHAWMRTVKYYEGMRLVYEVQSRYKEWAEQEEEYRKVQSKDASKGSPAPSRQTQKQ
jgi:hypothetical protein